MSETEAKPKRKDPYRDTLLLPRTSFAMKANLLEVEPMYQKFWERIGLYARIKAKKGRKGGFLLHDGPPYANGPIHLGHLLNKTLKDLVVRTRLMAGYEVEFVPGWDCHGLPIEHKVLKELGGEASGMDTIKVRSKCRSYAQKFVKLQTKQMIRLGTTGDYENPYLTMTPDYEGGVLEVFAELVEKGLVYRALKPVHWSIENRTALADAELEYYDREDTSVYVRFEVENPQALPPSLALPAGSGASLLIWTTTPWTLPANLAVAVSPGGRYCLIRFVQDGTERHAILVENLASTVFGKAGISEYETLGSCTGRDLRDAAITYRHPFIERSGRVVTADYVTFEDGTGLVHTAPGHGIEDYQTGLSEGLEVYCPVLPDGTFDNTAPPWLTGQSVWKANALITEHLASSASLLHSERFTHSYPHDWRSKTPTIFRATEQWFIAVDEVVPDKGKTLRELALGNTASGIEFVPDWGRNRLRGMLESRPDWCISRQRIWGLPIPSFASSAGEILLTSESTRAVAEKVRQFGSNLWFKATPGEILADYDPAADPNAPGWMRALPRGDYDTLKKGSDIFDVWFESGSSWSSVLKQRGMKYPADLYLEGSDQHRGWFQLSLLPALGVTGVPPFRTVLTHGFMVDAEGKKMSKSGGNAVDVDELLKKYGADVSRWWVSSLNYNNDVKVDWGFFTVAAEEYRKVRNTIRFILGNLHGFDPAKDAIPLTADDRHSIDAWALAETNALISNTAEAYEAFNFKRAKELVFNFCNDTLSSVYIAAAKDRLYCDSRASRKRLRTQTVLHFVVESLIRLLAPVLVHTAEDAYMCLMARATGDTDESVHMLDFPEPMDVEVGEGWEEAMRLRGRVLKALEDAKAAKSVRNPLDAGIVATVPGALADTLAAFEPEMADLCGVSRFSMKTGDTESILVVDLTEEPRCERSWKRDGTVRARSDGGMLSDRDALVVGVT